MVRDTVEGEGGLWIGVRTSNSDVGFFTSPRFAPTFPGSGPPPWVWTPVGGDEFESLRNYRILTGKDDDESRG